MFGGGRQMAYFGFLLWESAVNRPSDSHRAYQPASMAFGSKAFGIAVLVSGSVSFIFIGACLIAGFGSGAPARWSLLARLSRRGYRYAVDPAHAAGKSRGKGSGGARRHTRGKAGSANQ